MPAPPEGGHAVRAVGVIEVRKEFKAEHLRRALIEQNVPARDALEQGRARLNALSSLKVETTDAQKRCDDAEAALSDFDARSAERPRSLLPYIIVSAVLLLLFIFVPALPSPVALAGLSLIHI